MALQGEALLAVTGIFPEKALGPVDGEAARMLPGKWRTEIRAYFDQEKPTGFRLYKRPAHEVVLEDLTQGIDPGPITERMTDPDVQNDYMLALNNAREYVKERWPSLKIDTFTGPQLVQPGWSVMSAAWAILAVVDDPSRIIAELRSNTLAKEQVDAFKACYPALHQMVIALMNERKDLCLARSKSYRVPHWKEQRIRVLYQLPMGVSIAKAPQPPAQTATRDIKIDFAQQAQTRAQRIAAK